MIEPYVSEPMLNPTRPAAVADAGPAEEPSEPCLIFHGLRVLPPNHTSPMASSPIDNFATSTAPASSSRLTTVASASMIRSLNGDAPQVVLAPRVANKSLTP